MNVDHLPLAIERILEAATWAPSSHNTQPWKFVVEGSVIRIFPDFSRSLPVADPLYRELIISLGCALENLVIAARHEGYAVDTEIFPLESDGIVATLRPTLFTPDERQEALFAAIAERQTTRRPYDGQPLLPELEKAITSVPLEEGVHLRVLTDRSDMDKVATLVRKADEFLMQNPEYRRELADWVRFSRRSADEHRDGLTSAASGRRWAPEWLGRFFLRHMAEGSEQARADVQLLRSASGILLFYTVQNDPVSWIQLGRSFERVALTLTDLGLKHAHHNQPCEIPGLYSQFRRAFGPEVAFPQLMVRVGYAEAMPSGPRRKLEEVVA